MGRRWLAGFAALVAAVSLGALAAEGRSVDWVTTLTFDLSGPPAPFVPVDPPGRLPLSTSSLGIDYKIDRWTFSVDADLSLLAGLESVKVNGGGKLGDLSLRSAIAFSPIGKEISEEATSTAPVHTYDFDDLYSVDVVRAENVRATSPWSIWVSTDRHRWTAVSSAYPAAVGDSGWVQVDRLATYVEVRAAVGNLVASAASPEVVSIRFSDMTWQAQFSTKILDTLKLTGRVKLKKTQTPSLALRVRTMAGEISGDLKLAFRLERPSCCFCLDEASIDLGFPFGCLGEIGVGLEFSGIEFDEVSISLGSIQTGLSWLEASASVTFEADEKSFSFSPSLQLGSGTCIALEGSLLTGGSSTILDGVAFNTVSVECDWNGISFSSLSYFGANRYVPVRGTQECWESFTIAASGDACCGGLDFECTVAFAQTSTSLFDWAETDFSVSFDLNDVTTLSASLVIEREGSIYASVSLRTGW